MLRVFQRWDTLVLDDKEQHTHMNERESSSAKAHVHIFEWSASHGLRTIRSSVGTNTRVSGVRGIGVSPSSRKLILLTRQEVEESRVPARMKRTFLRLAYECINTYFLRVVPNVPENRRLLFVIVLCRCLDMSDLMMGWFVIVNQTDMAMMRFSMFVINFTNDIQIYPWFITRH